MSNVRKAKHGGILTAIFTLISVAYVMPIIIVIWNSFKRKIFISAYPFQLPDKKSFVGLENYIEGMKKIDFIHSFGYSVYINVCMVHYTC